MSTDSVNTNFVALNSAQSELLNEIFSNIDDRSNSIKVGSSDSQQVDDNINNDDKKTEKTRNKNDDMSGNKEDVKINDRSKGKRDIKEKKLSKKVTPDKSDTDDKNKLEKTDLKSSKTSNSDKSDLKSTKVSNNENSELESEYKTQTDDKIDNVTNVTGNSNIKSTKFQDQESSYYSKKSEPVSESNNDHHGKYHKDDDDVDDDNWWKYIEVLVMAVVITIFFLILCYPMTDMWMTMYVPDSTYRWLCRGLLFFIILVLILAVFVNWRC